MPFWQLSTLSFWAQHMMHMVLGQVQPLQNWSQTSAPVLLDPPVVVPGSPVVAVESATPVELPDVLAGSGPLLLIGSPGPVLAG